MSLRMSFLMALSDLLFWMICMVVLASSLSFCIFSACNFSAFQSADLFFGFKGFNLQLFLPLFETFLLLPQKPFSIAQCGSAHVFCQQKD
jgi:hypothetical protein